MMIRNPVRVISLVEKGWSAARQVTIHMTQQGIQVRHLVRGQIPRHLLEVITPYDGMVIRGIPRQWYRVIVWMELLVTHWVGRLSFVMVDNQNAADWIRTLFPSFADRTVVVQESPEGTPVLFKAGQPIEVGTLLSFDAT